MMAETFDPKEEGRRIASEYLSKRGWARERRRSLDRQVNPGFQREEFEEKERQCDRTEEDAETLFSGKVELYRKDGSSQAKAVLWSIVDILGRRTDLGFFAKRIIDRLKRELELF
ncbi:MAG: hypothetical protein U9R38_04335 [Candidatus Margulisiibacteriota bacterium]|nr:hypothetical protein [Candidatus Margulisiibacteriota bacterium]